LVPPTEPVALRWGAVNVWKVGSMEQVKFLVHAPLADEVGAFHSLVAIF